MKIINAALDGVLEALNDVGANRLSGHAIRFARLQLAVAEALKVRDQIRVKRILAYDETGQGWKDPKDAPPELLKEIADLMSESAEIDAESIPASLLEGEIDAKPNSLATLLSVEGLVVEVDE